MLVVRVRAAANFQSLLCSEPAFSNNSSLEQCLPKVSMHWKSLGGPVKTPNSDSIGLRWGLRICVSSKFPSNVHPSLGATFEEQLVQSNFVRI